MKWKNTRSSGKTQGVAPLFTRDNRHDSAHAGRSHRALSIWRHNSLHEAWPTFILRFVEYRWKTLAQSCQIFFVAYGQNHNKKWLFFEKVVAKNTKCFNYGNLYCEF